MRHQRFLDKWEKFYFFSTYFSSNFKTFLNFLCTVKKSLTLTQCKRLLKPRCALLASLKLKFKFRFKYGLCLNFDNVHFGTTSIFGRSTQHLHLNRLKCYDNSTTLHKFYIFHSAVTDRINIVKPKYFITLK